MKFLVDRMLGRLSAWLRILGYDTISANSFSGLSNSEEDTYMLTRSVCEQRTLLTRDAQLYERAKEKSGVSSLLIKEDNVFQQLKQVREHLVLTFPREPEIMRCSACNGMILPAPTEVVYGSREIKLLGSKGVNIAEFIQRHREFYACTSCGKVFWKGSHWHGILQKTRHLNA
ncbi:MAG: Mut7-C RNAse domain-containing protein [Euryarchaeota archaeon]|nr:Mut7-C RNAse domain-containing protein [Euryarchaeota archaeon]